MNADNQMFQGFDLASAPAAGANGIAWEFTGQVAETTGTGYGGYYVGYSDQGRAPPKPRSQSRSTEHNVDIFPRVTKMGAGHPESRNKKAVARPCAVQTESSVQAGWYSLDLPRKDFTLRGEIELEFVSDDGDRQLITLKRSGMLRTQRAAWIHFNRPGSLSVWANGEEPALREVGYAELISRSREMVVAKAELTVFLLSDVLPVVGWILLVWFIQTRVYRVTRLLPRAVRGRARREIDAMLIVAKWAGVSCYLIWTARDILSGVGITFVM